jgi:hypothetical protein
LTELYNTEPCRLVSWKVPLQNFFPRSSSSRFHCCVMESDGNSKSPRSQTAEHAKVKFAPLPHDIKSNNNTDESDDAAYSSSAPSSSSIKILHFNDVYNIEASAREPVGGAARFITKVKERHALAASSGTPSIVLFSGDALNPSLMSTVTRGKQMVPVLNACTIDVGEYYQFIHSFIIHSYLLILRPASYFFSRGKTARASQFSFDLMTHSFASYREVIFPTIINLQRS